MKEKEPEQEKQTKSMRLTLDYPTVDGGFTTKEMTVKFANPKNAKKHGALTGRWQEHAHVYEMSFSIEIPEFIHEELKGKSVGERKLGESSSRDSREYELDFPKSIKARSIDCLTEAWLQLVVDYAWLRKMALAPLQRVIFYKFDNASKKVNSDWNANHFGYESILHYKYALGYIKQSGKGSGKDIIRFNDLKKSLNTHYDREFFEYKYVNWTQEREDFFRRLDELFQKQIAAMAEFEKNLTETKINSFMQSKDGMLGLEAGKEEKG